MKESVIKFGPNKSLLGILTEPDPADVVEGSPVAVMLSAGITHRVGPFRLHVAIARRLAACGFRSLRFDLAGVGDSQIRPGKLDMAQRARLDVADAFDALNSKLGDQEFALLGLCSGAYNGHHVSVEDDRVVGAVFMDGLAFPTSESQMRRRLRYLRPRFWRNAIKRRLTAPKADTASQRAAKDLAASNFFDIDDIYQAKTAREIEAMRDRGVRMLFIFTDGYEYVTGGQQFQEMFGFEPDGDLLQLEYYGNAEHTFRLTANREVTVNRIAEWYQESYGHRAEAVETRSAAPV